MTVVLKLTQSPALISGQLCVPVSIDVTKSQALLDAMRMKVNSQLGPTPQPQRFLSEQSCTGLPCLAT